MTDEELDLAITNALEEEDRGIRSSHLAIIREGMRERIQVRDTLQSNVDSLTEQNKNLQKANYDLFMRIPVAGSDDNQEEKQEEKKKKKYIDMKKFMG